MLNSIITPVHVTSWLWLLFEIGLVIRDHVRGAGATRTDQGTRWVVIILTVFATLASTFFEILLPPGSPARFPELGHPAWPSVAGFVIMIVGLALRVWSVVVLGRAFRTTVEVERGQEVVTHGPYRWVRHPSYSGVLLLTLGYGVAAGNWLSLLVAIVAPFGSLLVRIAVEEKTLVQVLGRPYEQYCAATKRLVPGVW